MSKDKHYAIYFAGHGFAATDASEFIFTSEPSEALHWDRATATALIKGLRAESNGALDDVRAGIVEWIE